MPYQFTPPHVLEGPAGGHRLFQFYELKRGVSVLQFGEDFYEVRTPSQDDLQAADRYWLGGSTYDVDDATAQQLIDAGFEDCITEVV